jgi:magnesium-transporting ATPase (P-type)
VHANVFTFFNGLWASLFVLVALTGRWQNGLFGVIVVANAVIGIVQEWRAKQTLHRLALLHSPHARVIRATRAVAQLVLLDGRFAHLPEAVAEGRRVVANIERAASLFLVKNVYSLVMALISVVTLMAFPSAPMQLALISSITVGIPGFLPRAGAQADPVRVGLPAPHAAFLPAGRRGHRGLRLRGVRGRAVARP